MQEPQPDAAILRNLTRYLWPADNTEMKARVVAALGLLVASKALNIQVRFPQTLIYPAAAQRRPHVLHARAGLRGRWRVPPRCKDGGAGRSLAAKALM